MMNSLLTKFYNKYTIIYVQHSPKQIVDAYFCQKAQWQKKPKNKENERKKEYKW